MRQRLHTIIHASTAALALAASAAATDLRRGDPAPPLSLADARGAAIETAALRGRTLLLLFGEADQPRTHDACRQVAACLEAPALAGEPVTWVLVLSKGSRAEALPADVTAVPRPPVVVHDAQRRAFGDYGVVAAPTVVIVDGQGLVVHAMPGLTSRFADIVSDALLLAAGKLSAQAFEQTLHPSPGDAPEEGRLRAERTAVLARRLAGRGLDSLAETKYLEAIELDAGLTEARLGLGELLLRQRRFDEAAARFREALAQRPDAPRATLGLGFIAILREGGDPSEARRLATAVLELDPHQAGAHYLLGLVSEREHDPAAAAASFKRAALLLLEQAGSPAPDAPPDAAGGRP